MSVTNSIRLDFNYYYDGKLMSIVGAPYGRMDFSYYSDGRIMRITNTARGTVNFY